MLMPHKGTRAANSTHCLFGLGYAVSRAGSAEARVPEGQVGVEPT